jgi:hypothetical protein
MTTIKFKAADIIADCDPKLASMTLQAQLNPGEVVQLQQNSTASTWADVAALVMEQDMDACNEAGELACEEFSDLMEEMRGKEPTKGISIRWILVAPEEGDSVMLQLQALPCTAAGIKASPVFAEDNAAAIVLLQLPVSYQAFESGSAKGPIPILFSNIPEETAGLIRGNTEAIFKACQSLYSRIIFPEALNKAQAADYVKHPRPGNVSRPLLKSWVLPVHSDQKRPRLEVTDPMAPTGDIAGINIYKNYMFLEISR